MGEGNGERGEKGQKDNEGVRRPEQERESRGQSAPFIVSEAYLLLTGNHGAELRQKNANNNNNNNSNKQTKAPQFKAKMKFAQK